MKKALLIVNAVAGAAVLTVGFAVAALLVLTFSTSEPTAERETFFGSLVFESTERADGTLDVTAGVENPVPLLVLAAVLALMLAAIQLTYRALKAYRADLIAQRGGS